MSGVGGIVGTSKVLLIASTAGLLAVALLLSSFTTVTRVGGSLSLLWVNLGPSHSVWGRRRIGCVVSCFLSSHRSPLMRSNWVEWGGGRVRNSLGARIVEDDEKKMIHLNTLDRGKHGRCDY